MPARPLFLFGLTQRTGTHYLSSLLELHPRCVPISVPADESVSRPEDHLFDKADSLLRYVADVRAKWNPAWGLGDDAGELLLAELVDGISRFVVRLGTRDGGSPDYVMTKTPGTNHLRVLVECLPDLPVLVIARDGRDVVESARKTWGWSYERWTRVWRDGVDSLVAAQQIDRNGSIKVVRYEDLLAELRPTMESVLAHLDLPAAEYDWDAAAALPVRGSSFMRKDGGDLSWTPVKDTEGLIGRPRWADWPAPRLARFAHLAGAQMAHLGYDVGDVTSRPAVEPVRDALWSAARIARRARDRIKG